MDFIINSMDVDVMAGFAILNNGKIYDCSLTKEQIVEWFALEDAKIPLQSPLLWRRYYELMGRKEKVDMIDHSVAEKLARAKQQAADPDTQWADHESVWETLHEQYDV